MRFERAYVLFAATVGVALTYSNQQALACSCMRPIPQRSFVPTDGSNNVPIDATLRVFLHAFSPSVRAAIAEEYRLLDESGTEVPVDRSFERLRLDLRPRARLRPNTRYSLEQIFAYNAEGTRLSDDERQRPGGTGLRRAWYSVLSFRTGNSTDNTVRSGTATITRANLDFRRGGGDCGPGMAVDTAVRLPSSMRPTDLVRLEVRGPQVPPMLIDSRPVAEELFLGASNLLCDSDPLTVPFHGALEVRAVLLNAASAEVGATPWTPTQTGRFAPTPRAVQAPTTPAVITPNADWLAPPIVTPARSPTPRAEQCPNGLEITERGVLSERGPAPNYNSFSPLVQNNRMWFVLPGEGNEVRSHLLSFTANETPRTYATMINGHPHGVLANSNGLLLANTTYDAEYHSSLLLHAVAEDGTLRWSRSIPGFGSAPSMAVGAGRVFVSYQAGLTGINAVLLEEASGALSSAPFQLATQQVSDVYPSSAFVGGRFVVLWNPRTESRAALRFVSIAPDGTRSQPTELAIANYGPLDVAVAGNQLGVATATGNGNIEWTLLDARGAILRGPVNISIGTGSWNRKPRITFRDGLFSIAWEAHPGYRTFATVVDLAGRVAPPLTLTSNDEGLTAILLRNADRSFTASYTSTTQSRHPAMRLTLQCRSTPAPGAPAQIAPLAQ